MNFKELMGIDLTNLVDKKGKLSYVSWATAYNKMMEEDPNFTYTIHEDADGIPLFSRGKIHFVKTTCVYKGVSKSISLPIMNHACAPIDNPDSRDVSDSIMRCLAKNIAMFGFGLRLYVGEDTASISGVPAVSPVSRDEMMAFISTKPNRLEAIKKHNGGVITDVKYLKQPVMQLVYHELKMMAELSGGV